jgi:hypothetical protein
MDIAQAVQSLTGGNTVQSILARVIHQQNREAKLPLQQAEIPQQFSYIANMILVDAMRPHQAIQQQQFGLKPPDCLPGSCAVPIMIEPQRRRGDHVDLHLADI